MLVCICNGVLEVVCDGQVVEMYDGDLFQFIELFQVCFKVVQCLGLLCFCGGFVGYFGYDVVCYIEKKFVNIVLCDDFGLFDIQLLLIEEVVVIDNFVGKFYLIIYVDLGQFEVYVKVKQCLCELKQCLCMIVQLFVMLVSVCIEMFCEFKKDDYLVVVCQVKEYIVVGELMQIQVGQWLMKLYCDNLLLLYCVLCLLNLLLYMYYYNFGDFYVVGVLLEILVCQEKCGEDQIVMICLFVGMCLCGNMFECDVEFVIELFNDLKEIVEYVMLIDFVCNDVGCIVEIGLVQVIDQMVIEKYLYVQYIVSLVEGKLKFGMMNYDVLCVIFLVGMLFGVLKVCVMELIDEFELVKCGLYGGVVGYLLFLGEMDFVIVICMGLIYNGNLYV